MGTRNITRVIYKKEIIVNQYCQWDGYPTGHGLSVLEFVKKYCCVADQLKEFKKRLAVSCLLKAESGKYTYTGAPATKTVRELDEIKYNNYSQNWNSASEFTWEKLIKEGTVTKHQVREFLTASRDTGSDILKWLMVNEPHGMTFYTTEYDLNMKPELDWQIEGMYIIDLDNNTVTIDYHGKCREYTFKRVAEMDEEQMETEMKDMERGDED